METNTHKRTSVCAPIEEFQVGMLDENGQRITTRSIEAWNSHAWPWQARPVPADNEEGGFYACTAYRQIVYHGHNYEEAIGNMLRGVAELARRGSINPKHPSRPGRGGLQHILELLQEQLEYCIGRRQEIPEFHGKGANPGSDGRAALMDPQFLRTNEIISGLATAIAALARIKEM